MAKNNTPKSKFNRVSTILWVGYFCCLIFTGVITYRIIELQWFWEPDARYMKYFIPTHYADTIRAERGSIFDCNGKLLATSTPMYELRMDCTIRLEEFAGSSKRDSLERDWRTKAKSACQALPEILSTDKDAAYYYNLIIENRTSKKGGRKNVLLGRGIDHGQILKIRELPLFNEGRFKSGLKEIKYETRQYPYKGLGTRTIGDIRIINGHVDKSRNIGIESQYNDILKGEDGVQWMKKTDRGLIIDTDSTYVEMIPGYDIKTTLDVNIQDITDRALRKNLSDLDHIESGCAIVMEVETGAIKAMVNLKKDKNNVLRETYNIAIGQAGEPGSVMKTAALMSLLEDGHTELSARIPTNRGITECLPKAPRDPYIVRYERETKDTTISVLKGLEISSNHVFRHLVVTHYEDKPERFIKNLQSYGLGNDYSFDITEGGGAKPTMRTPESKDWNKYDLGSLGYGYALTLYPLNIITFYNGIANDGRLMKPYLINAYMKDGEIEEEFDPEVLTRSMCSQRTIDSLKLALTEVTTSGTAKRLKNAKYRVAGKTGTSRVKLSYAEMDSKSHYTTADGRKKNQATFVGFFPVDKPEYSILVSVYTRLSNREVGGGSIPAATVNDITNEIWAFQNYETLGKQIHEDVPDMEGGYMEHKKNENGNVPNVYNMGLKDAIFLIENCGYKCRYEGIGKVYKQSPAPGTKGSKGDIVTVHLR